MASEAQNHGADDKEHSSEPAGTAEEKGAAGTPTDSNPQEEDDDDATRA